MKAKAEEIDKTLRADVHFNHIVMVEHGDGTKLELHYATLVREDEWVMIFTEHNGTFVYHNEDLNKIEEIEGAKKALISELVDYVDEPVDMVINKRGTMKTVAIEDLVISTILTFCENAAELGCPRDKEVDMWFRELSYEDARKVVDKMMVIEERNSKIEEK